MVTTALGNLQQLGKFMIKLWLGMGRSAPTVSRESKSRRVQARSGARSASFRVRSPGARAGRLFWFCTLSLGIPTAAITCGLAATPSETYASPPSLPDSVLRAVADIETVERRYRLPLDIKQQGLLREVLQGWLAELEGLDIASLGLDDRLDRLLLINHLTQRMSQAERQAELDRAAADQWLPYADTVVALCRIREEVEPFDPAAVAEQLQAIANLASTSSATTDRMEGLSGEERADLQLSCLRASQLCQQMRSVLAETHRFRDGYDPLYSWWAAQPYREADAALAEHHKWLKAQTTTDPGRREPILGQPIGRQALIEALRHEFVPYSPEELVAIADREFAWCLEQSRRASEALGFGGVWEDALEHVKRQHVAPGEQPAMIRQEAEEAIEFLEARELITIPTLSKQGWRMQMMTAEQQRVNPYFLGGDSIIVSFPTAEMSHSEKEMSLRSNNRHFARATVHHELVPGHHLQYHTLRRHRPYRRSFSTPFWLEGWALYWEMRLWDLGFARSHEDEIGMLFWRRHRCARIIFSLNYHLGVWTPQQCIDYLIEVVGHEPSAAEAEVRRSVMGDYGPLYQAAYMLGGLQLRALHHELVVQGNWTERQFHDAVLAEHSIPIEVLRLKLTKQPPGADYQPQWRFADE